MIQRRDLLKLAPAALLLNAPALAKTARSKGRPLGLQSFTVMKMLEADFDGTLALCASLGYREIETLGSFNRDPAMVRETLARHGLTTPSQHMMPDDLYATFNRPVTNDEKRKALGAKFTEAFNPDKSDRFVSQAIERAKGLGQKYVVWQLGWRPQFTLKDADRYVSAFNRAGDLCASAGLGFAYHNHDHEFELLEGKIPFDILVSQTDPDKVKVEIDFWWAIKGGGKPIELFRRYKNRFRLCHLKDHSTAGEIVTVGEGVENFRLLLDAAKLAGIEHYFFEFDRPVDALKEIKAAAAYLKPLLA